MLQLPTVLLALAGVWLGSRVRGRRLAAWGVLAGVMALPWLLAIAYYSHLLDSPLYYQWRSQPLTDWLVSGAGLGVGLVVGAQARTQGLRAIHVALAAVLAILALTAAFAKPWLQPELPILEDRWSDGVCLQSSHASCGPCAAATLLRHHGIESSEAEVAEAADTRAGGTLNWRLARVLRSHGLELRFRAPNDIEEVAHPAIVGVRLGGPAGIGHFVVLLGRDGDELVIGEPLEGRLILSPAAFSARYHFDRFALELETRQP